MSQPVPPGDIFATLRAAADTPPAPDLTLPGQPEWPARPPADLLAQESELAAVPGRVLLDSSLPGLIPADAAMVAGYVDGHYEWQPDDWQRFTAAKPERVHITVEPFDHLGRPTGYPNGNYRRASVIDVESGAFNVGNAARFLPQRAAYRPGTETAYCDEATLPQLLRACRAIRGYWLWLAWFINHPPTAAQIDAVHAQLAPWGVRLAAWQHTPGPRYDTSLVIADGWHKEHTP